jgi:uncharacterized protein (DUF58 family)
MSDLTLRARCFLGAGIVAVVCGIQMGQSDFVRIGLVALAAPVLAWLLVRTGERRLTVRRNLDSLRVEASVTNLGRRTPPMLLEEGLPAALGTQRRFVVEALPSQATTTLRYLVRTRHRGRHEIGPARLHAHDPLGMVDLVQPLEGTQTLLVTPRTEALPAIALSGRWGGAGENRARELLGGGSPDVTIRDYRRGDDLRRIHWPSSARNDTLMVRREEQEWQLRCTLLLDDRRSSHRGRGRASTLELAVSAAASILRHLTARGYEVHLVTSEGPLAAPGVHDQLERLAVLGLSRRDQLELGWVHDAKQGGLLLAVLGGLDPGDRQRLAPLARVGDAAHAVVVDVDGTPAAQTTVDELAGGGWRAITFAPGDSLATAWQGLAP